MDILLISTTDMKGGRSDVRDRMLQSVVDSQRTLGTGGHVALWMLLQNCPAEELAACVAGLPALVHAVAVPGRVPLSAARNLLLRQLLAERTIGADSLVAFPDDDAWYPEGFLSQVATLFGGHPELDFWFCRYASRPVRESFAHAAPQRARTGQLVRNVSSNNMFLRGRVVTATGGFDETLGIGTPAGGAEDLDYALRASRQSRRIAYRDSALVGHRDKSPAVRTRYYGSSLQVLARHAHHGAAAEFLRKIAVGAFLTLRRELSPGEFGRALVQAWSARRPNP